MKITAAQLKQLIREQVEEMESEMGGVDEGQTKAQRAAREAELQRMRDVGTKMRTDWEDKVSAYAKGKIKIFKFSAAYGGYMESETVLGFGLGKNEEEAREDAKKKFPDDASEIGSSRANAYQISEKEFEAEQKSIMRQLKGLRALEDRARAMGKVSEELFGLGRGAETRSR